MSEQATDRTTRGPDDCAECGACRVHGDLLHEETCPIEVIELVMRSHLGVQFDDYRVLCLCDVGLTFEGPVYHRQHVAAEILKALQAGQNATRLTDSRESEAWWSAMKWGERK